MFCNCDDDDDDDDDDDNDDGVDAEGERSSIYKILYKEDNINLK